MKKVRFNNKIKILYFDKHKPIINFKNNNKIKLFLVLSFMILSLYIIL